MVQNDMAMEALQVYVFGLLLSPLLKAGALSDERAIAEAMLSSILPSDLCKSLYPDLATVENLDTGDLGSPMRLSREAISTSARNAADEAAANAAKAEKKGEKSGGGGVPPPRVLLLDGLSQLCVYYPWETLQGVPGQLEDVPLPSPIPQVASKDGYYAPPMPPPMPSVITSPPGGTVLARSSTASRSALLLFPSRVSSRARRRDAH